MSIVVVTGAAGYIGGEIALLANDAGHTVIGIDRDPCPTHLGDVMSFVQADFDSDESYRKILEVRPDAIVHCAGTSLVGPSIAHPSDYYNNNVIKTMHLLGFVAQALPGTRVIFSSSAAVYGEPIMTPCHEVDPCEPISPYGESKMMIEQVLKSYHTAYNLNYVAFRYFNACGADSQGRHGQAPGATHIIARVLESIRDDGEFVLYGTTYPTDDGTCVRDYVHVEDIARAHIMALNSSVPSGIYNLGSEQGTSNAEIVKTVLRITDKQLNLTVGEKREGDPPVLTASPAKFESVAGAWRRHDLTAMIEHAWAWYNS
jgi:UDP-glucose 4-epimerase